jgi:hypothetical protein
VGCWMSVGQALAVIGHLFFVLTPNSSQGWPKLHLQLLGRNLALLPPSCLRARLPADAVINLPGAQSLDLMQDALEPLRSLES